MTFDGCDCSDCVARKVGELILYALELEKAVAGIKRCVDAGNGELAYRLMVEAAAAVEARNLSGEISRAAMERNMQDAAELRRTGRLH